MSKRPITYSVDTPERPAKRRQVSSSIYTGSTYTGFTEDMDEDEVTSTLKRKLEHSDTRPRKYMLPTTWAMSVNDMGIREPDSGGFVHPYVAPKGEKRKADAYSPAGSIINPTRGERPLKRATPISWAMSVNDMGIREPDSGDFVHPYPYEPPIEVPVPPPTPVSSPDVKVGMPEPSTSGYKISSNYNTMSGTTYKYLHVDSHNRLTHETNSKITVNFGGLPIENIKRVGVLKATITNTGHNVYENHDQVKIAVRVAAGVQYVVLTLDHDYYTIAQMVTALNAKLQAYTNATAVVQTAVRDLLFAETAGEEVEIKVKTSPDTVADTDVSYSLIADHLTDQANTLLYELGFDKTRQTFDPNRYADYLAADLHDTSHYGTLILPSQNFYGRIFYQPKSTDTRPTSLTAFHRYVIENTKGFYLCSSALTSGGNVLKAQVIGNGRAIVQHDSHLVFIPNKALRDQYNHYETNVIEWVDVYGDLQTFDLEIRSHSDKPLTSSVGSAAPPFVCTLIFETESEVNKFGADSLAYAREAYLEAHRQN
jgi:hypothetical protein